MTIDNNGAVHDGKGRFSGHVQGEGDADRILGEPIEPGPGERYVHVGSVRPGQEVWLPVSGRWAIITESMPAGPRSTRLVFENNTGSIYANNRDEIRVRDLPLGSATATLERSAAVYREAGIDYRMVPTEGLDRVAGIVGLGAASRTAWHEPSVAHPMTVVSATQTHPVGTVVVYADGHLHLARNQESRSTAARLAWDQVLDALGAPTGTSRPRTGFSTRPPRDN